MQDELDAEYPSLDIEILSINKIGASSGVSSLSSDMDLPMVDDNSTDQIWSTWDGIWRDVIILDANNEIYAVYNLSTYSLSDSTNYNTLKDLFIEAANP